MGSSQAIEVSEWAEEARAAFENARHFCEDSHPAPEGHTRVRMEGSFSLGEASLPTASRLSQLEAAPSWIVLINEPLSIGYSATNVRSPNVPVAPQVANIASPQSSCRAPQSELPGISAPETSLPCCKALGLELFRIGTSVSGKALHCGSATFIECNPSTAGQETLARPSDGAVEVSGKIRIEAVVTTAHFNSRELHLDHGRRKNVCEEAHLGSACLLSSPSPQTRERGE